VPDAEVGTLAIRSLSSNNGIIRADLNNGSMDQVFLTGNFGLNTNSFFGMVGTTEIDVNNLTSGGVVNAGTYTLLKYSGSATLTDLSWFTLGTTNIGSVYTLTLQNNTSNFSVDLNITRTGAVTSASWNVDANGSWSAPANWTSAGISDFPNAINAIATFGTAINQARTVTVDSVKTVGTLNFTSPFSYTISGASNQTISFQATSGTTGIGVTAGAHTITSPVKSFNNMAIDVASGARLAMTSSLLLNDTTGTITVGRNLTKTGSGTLQVQHIRNTFGSDGSASLTISGGRVVVAQTALGDTIGTSKVNGLSIATGAVLDLTNNSMIIDYQTGNLGTLLTDIRSMLASGKITTSVDTSGGTRDMRIGYNDNNDTSAMGNSTSATSFAGLAVDASSMLLKYTYGGDTNLDGKVDIKDLYNLALHYSATNTTPQWSWSQGDFNYDGLVNKTDLTLLARDWQATGALGAGNLSAALASLGLPNVSVPEPASIGLIGLGVAGLISRRRRSRRA
jgi:hypothetical protein